MQNRLQDAIAALFQKFKTYRKNEVGNIAMMFGLSAVLVILGVGSAVDYARVVNAKANLTAALDSASLFAAAINGEAEPVVKQRAQKYFDENYTNTRDAEVKAFNLKNFEDHVEVSGTVEVKTWFMSVGGIYKIDVTGTSEVLKNGNSIEVSLVLDVTGSMEGDKLSSLKNAANRFIDEVVWNGQTSQYSKVALVPFSEGVNLNNRVVEARGPLIGASCAVPGCTTYELSSGTYNATSCVTERTGTEKYTDAAISANPVGVLYLQDATDCDKIQPVVPLTNDRTLLHKTIDALKTYGNTAGQVGLAWGWYTISPTSGFWSGTNAPAPYPNAGGGLKKIAVFMTDGEFNVAYCYGVESKNSCPATNGDPTEQALHLCDAMKAKGITIYTIGFQLEVAKADDFMKACATDSTTYFDADNEAELGVAFAEVSKSVLELRVSK
jgi:Flp pilus assembly protein TadG